MDPPEMDWIFILIILFLVLDFLIERFLDMLNLKSRGAPIPEDLSGIYDSGKYAKQQAYETARSRLGLVMSSVNFAVLLAMLAGNGFAWVDTAARGAASSPILVTLVFFGILSAGLGIIGLPFDLYGTFVIEERFGFNKTTPRTFMLDKMKGILLGVLIGGGLLSLVTWLFLAAGRWFWVLGWAATAAFSIVMAAFYSTLIVPLFNKQTPLEDGDLKSAISAFTKKTDFKLKDIFVIDGSKRSTKANAYFSGLGPRKRIVLYDTLMETMGIDEILAILAHEIGHYRKKHTLKGSILGMAQALLLFYLFSLLASSPSMAHALGAREPGFHLALVAFSLLFTPVSFVLGLLTHHLQRRMEFTADRFASEHGTAEGLSSGLKKLASRNLVNLTPHPAYVFVHYSHPPLLERLRALARLSG